MLPSGVFYRHVIKCVCFMSRENTLPLSPCQMPVFDTMGLDVCRAERFFPICLVFGIVSLKPDDFTIALEGKDVGGNPVQKPAVMADYHDTTGEIFQGVFQGSHGVYVEIVCGFVQQKHIGAFFQHTGKMYPVPFSPGERSYRFLLVCSGKIKTCHVCT